MYQGFRMLIISKIFYFFFGMFMSAYLYVLFLKKKSSPHHKHERFYINIFFLDREEFIRNIVRSKVSKSRWLIRALAKRAAVALLTGDIVEKIGHNLCKSIPERLDVMGVRCTANIGYTQAAFICIEVALVEVDLPKFILYNAGEAASLKIKNMITKMFFPSLEKFVNEFLLAFLKGKLMKQLPVTLMDKLQDKMNAEIELICCTEEEQGPFLVDTIQQIKLHANSILEANNEQSQR